MSDERINLIVAIAIFILYFFLAFPMQTITVIIIIVCAYLLLTKINGSLFSPFGRERGQKRREALSVARLYLAPYSNIWNNLRLSNRICSVSLINGGKMIIAKEKSASSTTRIISVSDSSVYNIDDLWNMLCINFDNNTTFYNITELCKTFGARVKFTGDEKYEKEVNQGIPNTAEAVKSEKRIVTENNREKLDINNASEVELTSLPGVSIVLAKKLIKRRDEIGGFKTVEEVFSFLKLKPHMQQQLEQKICVNKMLGKAEIRLNRERSIDL